MNRDGDMEQSARIELFPPFWMVLVDMLGGLFNAIATTMTDFAPQRSFVWRLCLAMFALYAVVVDFLTEWVFEPAERMDWLVGDAIIAVWPLLCDAITTVGRAIMVELMVKTKEEAEDHRMRLDGGDTTEHQSTVGTTFVDLMPLLVRSLCLPRLSPSLRPQTPLPPSPAMLPLLRITVLMPVGSLTHKPQEMAPAPPSGVVVAMVTATAPPSGPIESHQPMEPPTASIAMAVAEPEHDAEPELELEREHENENEIDNETQEEPQWETEETSAPSPAEAPVATPSTRLPLQRAVVPSTVTATATPTVNVCLPYRRKMPSRALQYEQTERFLRDRAHALAIRNRA